MELRKQIVLASSSVIRRKIMEDVGLSFSVRTGDVDEDKIKSAHLGDKKPINELPSALALAKVGSIELFSNEICIGADQIMEMDGHIFDKPKTMAEAKTRLQLMRGKTHRLIGSVVCIENSKSPWIYTGETSLKMRQFSDAFLDDYLGNEGCDVLTSVGGYMFERRGAQLFETVKGDFFSILGLPLLPLLTHLRARKAALS